MEKLSSQYHFQIPKGASGKVIDSGKSFVRKFGVEELDKICKAHFKTRDAVLSEIDG